MLPRSYLVLLFLTYTFLSRVYYCFSCVIKTLPVLLLHFAVSSVTEFLKVINIVTLTSLNIYDFFLYCSDLETSSGPKCSMIKMILIQFACLKLSMILLVKIMLDKKIDGCNLKRSDHPSNLKKDKVCIHFNDNNINRFCSFPNGMVKFGTLTFSKILPVL